MVGAAPLRALGWRLKRAAGELGRLVVARPAGEATGALAGFRPDTLVHGGGGIKRDLRRAFDRTLHITRGELCGYREGAAYTGVVRHSRRPFYAPPVNWLARLPHRVRVSTALGLARESFHLFTVTERSPCS